LQTDVLLADSSLRGPVTAARSGDRPTTRGETMMRVRVLAAAMILAASGGCATVKETLKTTPDTIERPATGAPATFVRGDGLPNVNTACLTPMLDQRDNTTVELVRSRNGQGDYRVPAGKYGVGGNELLRIDCTTGVPKGIVREQ
jgi:hypothetical protein